MSTLTPINGWSIPALSDAPNITSAVNTAINAIDARVNPIFTTTAARNAAITSPVEGMECYVTGTKEKYLYDGTTWVSAKPRIIRKGSTSSRQDTTVLADATGYAFTVEANSRYRFTGEMYFFSTGTTSNDINIGWTFPSGLTGLWSIKGPPTGFTDSGAQNTDIRVGARDFNTTDSYGTILAAEWCAIHGVVDTTGTAGTLQLQFAELTGVAGVTSVSIADNSFFEVWKIG